MAITSSGNIVAVDSVSPTVFVIAESGELVRWFDCSDYMREPSDIAVSGKEFFVCDFKGHCVVVFSEVRGSSVLSCDLELLLSLSLALVGKKDTMHTPGNCCCEVGVLYIGS